MKSGERSELTLRKGKCLWEGRRSDVRKYVPASLHEKEPAGLDRQTQPDTLTAA